ATPPYTTHSLHDALPISVRPQVIIARCEALELELPVGDGRKVIVKTAARQAQIWLGIFVRREGQDVSAENPVRKPVQQHVGIERSEEHTSELQSRFDLVC